MAISFTESQKRAIESSGHSVVVSAAAGSGKTAVLVERIMRRITGDNPVDIDRLLIVTFTKAAAADMKLKISRRLSELMLKDPNNKNLKRQQLLLQTADIGTTHAFCSELIKNNFAVLDVPPDSRVGDDSAIDSLEIEAATRAIEQFYEEDENRAAQLAMAICSGRNDNGFEKVVIEFAKKIRTRFDGERLFYSDIEKTEENCSQFLREYIKDSFSYAKSCFESALLYCEDTLSVRIEGLLQNIKMTDRVLESMQKDSFELFDIVSSCKVLNLEGKATAKNAEDANAGKELHTAAKKAIEKCVKLVENGDFKEDFAYNKMIATDLFSVTKSYIALYNESKNEKGLLDYTDLELLAVKLLYENGEPSERAKFLREHYDEVYVDEFQDANEIQDMIYRAVSRDEENIFVVGDVKQSIYSFRGAEPDIFIDKQSSFEKGDKGELVRLQNNFRSAKKVVDFVNKVFLHNMEEVFSSIDYKKEQLVCSSPLSIEGEAKLLTFTKNGGEKEVESEAKAVAKRIRNMVDSGVTVMDGGSLRPCRYGDFAILLRVCKKVDNIFHDALKEQGISSVVRGEKPLFDEPEISLLISFLRALHNPTLDIPLLATMLSPFFDFDTNRLVSMKTKIKKSFSETVFLSDERDIKEFRDSLQEMREQCATMPVLDFLKSVVSKYGYSQTMKNRYKKSEVTQNIRLFFEILGEMQQRGCVYLSSVVFEFNNMKRNNINPKTAAVPSKGDKVSIMSVHVSKGLEFKICFVCDLRHRINYENTARFFYDQKLGSGFKRILPGGDIYTNTLAFKTIRHKKQNDTVKEFLRLLYVALTRAEQKLFLPIEEGEISDLEPVDCDPHEIAGASSFLSFIKNVSGALEREPILGDEDETEMQGGEDEKTVISDLVFEKIDYEYKYLKSTKTPLKLSVTELVHKEDGFEFAKIPMFEMGEHAADRGNAVHKLLQFIDFERDVFSEVERLYDEGILSAEQKELISIEEINKLIKGEFSDIIKKGKLLREFRFLSTTLQEFGDKSMLQGVVDALVLAEDGIYIIDYKTDRVLDVSILQERYQKQLDLYAEAIERHFEQPVLKKYIVSVYKNEILEV